jgi:hypothetical protein
VEDCVGSCALVRLENNVKYIITSRHVVFDEDEDCIFINSISFKVGSQTYSNIIGNVKYHGSSDSERDLAFFQVIGNLPHKGGFHLSLSTNVYQGQSIGIFGFPLAVDEEHKFIDDPKLLLGSVSAAGAAIDIALTDISGSMPNMSGGAVLDKMYNYSVLAGIHMGNIWHDAKDKKPVNEVAEVTYTPSDHQMRYDRLIIPTEPTVAAVVDDQSPESPEKAEVPNMEALILGSPPENARSRGFYAVENIPHKGSMTYFVPSHTIIRYLEPLVGKKMMKHIAQTNTIVKRKKLR